MIVMKFGGTSVGNAAAILETVAIVSQTSLEPAAVVVSALAGVTDSLLKLANTAAKGFNFENDLMLLESQHRETIAGLIKNKASSLVWLEVQALFVDLKNILSQVRLELELSNQSKDLIVSFGERWSAKIVAGAMNENGLAAVSVDARTCVVTDDNFTDAKVDFENTKLKILEHIPPLFKNNQIVVVTGFIGATSNGVTTTIGRGGSDYTAAILAAQLEARELWIWKEVDGVLSADPKIVVAARLIEAMSYKEAAELSYFGAKVLHPKTMLPVMAAGIPVRLRNTFAPSGVGTVISKDGSPSVKIKAVTAKKNMNMITVEGLGMVGITGFAAKVFAAAARAQVNLVMFSQSSSEQNICLLASAADALKLKSVLGEDLQADIFKQVIDPIKISETVAVVAVVGDGMRGEAGVAARVFAAVASSGANVLAIAQGSSERIISFVVAESVADQVVLSVHTKCLQTAAVESFSQTSRLLSDFGLVAEESSRNRLVWEKDSTAV